MNGKIVLYKQLKDNANREQINISSFASGMYKIIWQQGDTQFSWKLLKQ